ncbi:hypothetical protein [Streptomyces sp. NPDC052535]|uniref:hypothetical protein n=1 Tax=Streptomyces sp. NPDC052535 TaxID=3155531 RepID=UPI00343E719B
MSNSVGAVVWLDALIMALRQGDVVGQLKIYAAPPLHGWERLGSEDSIIEHALSPLVNATVASVLFLSFWLVPPVLLAGAAAGRPWSWSTSTRLMKRFGSVHATAISVAACVRVRKASWAERPKELRRLSRATSRVEDRIMWLHRHSGHLPPRSHRKHLLKQHTGLVVAAIRRAEARVDSEGDEALEPLAALLITVGERIAEGRIGALLDADQIDADLTPARDWEPLRLAVAAALVAGCAVGVGLLSLPDGVDVYVIGGCSIVILAMLYGRRVHQVLDVISVIRGS